jgi:hypothetical protein
MDIIYNDSKQGGAHFFIGWPVPETAQKTSVIH